MTVPLWLAEAIVVALLGQFIAVAAWMIRQDKDRAVGEAKMEASIKALSEKVEALTKMLTEHNPIRAKADADAVEERVSKLESGQASHHKLIRGLQRRLDLSHVASDGDDDGG